MANIKITDLTAYGDPTSTDVLPIVDVGADVTKKVSVGDLLENAGSGTAAAPGIAFDGDSNTGIYRPGADQLAISTNGSEAARIDSSGRLLINTSSSLGNDSTLQVVNDSSTSIELFRGQNLRFGSACLLSKSRGSSALPSAVNANDEMGTIAFRGYDGSSFINSAFIVAEVDGTPGANDMPGRLVFSVTADGASSPTEAMRIKNTRVINFSNAPVYADNAAAKTGGLVDGDVYRTSTGDLKIVYS